MAPRRKIQTPFQAKLRFLRKRFNWSQQYASLQCDMPITEWQALERGRIANPRIDTVKKIANTFAISIDHLLDFRPPKAPPQPSIIGEDITRMYFSRWIDDSNPLYFENIKRIKTYNPTFLTPPVSGDENLTKEPES
ncbi:helix-turn-helix domain-containing protein [Candidatus Margulisiibacteriota bacterium]